MALKLKREVERERAKGNEERRKCVFFDLLDSFSYTGSSRRRGRERGGGPFWIPPPPLKRPRVSIYFTNKPNKKPRHHLPKEDVAAPPPLKKPKKPRNGDTSYGACAVNVKKVSKSRNLPKADVDVNVNVKTVTLNKKKKKKKETTQLTVAEKRSEAYRRVPPDFDFKPPRSCHHLIQEDHTFDHWRVLVICILLNMTTGKQAYT